MFLFFNWKEVFLSHSLNQFNQCRLLLNHHGIEYKYDVKNHEDFPPFRPPASRLLGRAGERQDYAKIYYLYVRKSDYPEAKHLIQTEIQDKSN